jgi:tRNA A37 threonylcarbamoyladenosine synthetase subunit TsaC/SUA5/YrdC
VPSTVADCTADPVRCVRDGGVSWVDIDAVLGGLEGV